MHKYLVFHRSSTQQVFLFKWDVPEPKLKRLWSFEYVMDYVLITVLILLINYVSFSNSKVFIYILAIGVFNLLLREIKISYKKYTSKEITYNTSMFAYIIWVLMVIYITETLVDVQNTALGKYNGTIIVTADSTYISSDSISYVGKTENYVFIYDFNKRRAIVLPKEVIKKMDIKKRFMVK